MFPGDYADGEASPPSPKIVITERSSDDDEEPYRLVGLKSVDANILPELLAANHWLMNKAKGKVRWRGMSRVQGDIYDVYRVYDEHDATLFKLFFYGH